MKPITTIRTPFPEKFGVPRQPLLVSEAIGIMLFPKDEFHHEAFRGLEESSHVWLIFEFHLIPSENFNGLVRPPRYDSKRKLGVYATRTPHRPNRLGLSAVKLDRIEYDDKHIKVIVSGVDLVDGTPVFDIKPYVPYTDKIDAVSPFKDGPATVNVVWLCEKVTESNLIEKVIALDPRPGHSRNTENEYGVSIAGYNVRFRFSIGHFEIISAISFE